MNNRKIIALTGPIAAGKNAAADILAQAGYPVIDADIVAHKAINKAASKIYETFQEQAEKTGVQILNEDGTVISKIKFIDVYINGIEGLEFNYNKIERDSNTFDVSFKFNNIDFDYN